MLPAGWCRCRTTTQRRPPVPSSPSWATTTPSTPARCAACWLRCTALYAPPCVGRTSPGHISLSSLVIAALARPPPHRLCGLYGRTRHRGLGTGLTAHAESRELRGTYFLRSDVPLDAAVQRHVERLAVHTAGGRRRARLRHCVVHEVKFLISSSVAAPSTLGVAIGSSFLRGVS